ncbi:MAG TPA: hypothetical protein VLE48_13445, partial [Terriglobales bacterium]|nr:hypothetical protein [Terriglobales bacterium]
WKRWRGGFYYAAVPEGSGKAAPESLGVAYASRWEREEDAERFATAYAGGIRKRYQRATGAGMNRWDTDEGPVSIEVAGKSVLVLEGFDDDTAGRLREAFFPRVQLSAEK